MVFHSNFWGSLKVIFSVVGSVNSDSSWGKGIFREEVLQATTASKNIKYNNAVK
jgi:hypothetical protein